MCAVCVCACACVCVFSYISSAPNSAFLHTFDQRKMCFACGWMWSMACSQEGLHRSIMINHSHAAKESLVADDCVCERKHIKLDCIHFKPFWLPKAIVVVLVYKMCQSINVYMGTPHSLYSITTSAQLWATSPAMRS